MSNRYEIAEQNGMSHEFVDWFFDHKKDGCGNAWFMIMAAMWEGWKGRTDNTAVESEPIYQCEFCHHDGNGELQWHWEDVNKTFYEQYDEERRGKRRILYLKRAVIHDAQV